MTTDPMTVLTEAPDGTALAHSVLVERQYGGWLQLTCEDCGRDVSFVNATPQRVQWFTTSHRCGGVSWQGP